MDQAWTSKPEAERVLALATDSRPAWLWSGDGARLIWQNHAASLFGAKIKNETLRRADTPTPVKGQIGRILRLGLVGRPMLSRMQFIAGRKPLSATCICTPLALEDEKHSLLVVGADSIAADILALDPIEPVTPDADIASDAPIEEASFDAPPADDSQNEQAETPEDAAIEMKDEPPSSEQNSADDVIEGEVTLQTLGALVDRLAGDERLFAPLDEDDEPSQPDDFTASSDDNTASDVIENAPQRESDWDHDDPLAREEQAFTEDSDADHNARHNGLWQLTGRGLTVTPQVTVPDTAESTPPPAESEPVETIEQVSRYNFEELGRILHDRVGRDADAPETRPAPQPSNLVSLSDETLVLNRLPLGILIFRDQDILFANRALVDLTGYDNAAMLRAVGLASVIPIAEGSEPAGPVSQLLRRDGSRLAVAARLHTVSWQGRGAMMLSARAMDGDAGREDDIRRFASDFATLSRAGYIELDRIGIITATGGHLDALPANARQGERISQLIAHDDLGALSRFLALPARFAETERPAISLNGRLPNTMVRMFALGRAGFVSGYSAVFERQSAIPDTPGALSAAALGRIGRELRRPLNTIVGFSELMVSESFGPVSNPRYLEYARDINAAGSVITDLADELDDYVRIAEGKLELEPGDIDLSSLLADCLVRVRGQAGTERVLLRSAISERLPMVRADAATLRQAILNMLASAINEAGEGSKVVLSAQREDDGAVSIHVRDAARKPGDLAEQFVVYRDGEARDGTARQPVRSSIGLTLTRTLVAVNACSLSLDPTHDSGTLMTLTIPASLVVA